MTVKYYLLLLFSFYSFILKALNFNVGISANYMIDRDFNKPLEGLFISLPNISLYSNVPISVGLVLEKKTNFLSPSIGINVILRNIRLLNDFDLYTTFYDQTLEIPLKVTYRNEINQNVSCFYRLGAGLNTMLTSTNKNTEYYGGFSDPIYVFKIINPEQINTFISAGLGIENKMEKIGILKFNLEYIYQTKKYFAYQIITDKEIGNSKSFRPSYLMLGLTYSPNFLNKNKFLNLLMI